MPGLETLVAESSNDGNVRFEICQLLRHCGGNCLSFRNFSSLKISCKPISIFQHRLVITFNFFRIKILQKTLLPSIFELVFVLSIQVPKQLIWFDLQLEISNDWIFSLFHIEVFLLLVDVLHLSAHIGKLFFDLKDIRSITINLFGVVVIFVVMNLLLYIFNVLFEIVDLGNEHVLDFSPFVLQLFLTIFDNFHDFVDELESKSDSLDVFIILSLSWVGVKHHKPLNTVSVFFHQSNLLSSLKDL